MKSLLVILGLLVAASQVYNFRMQISATVMFEFVVELWTYVGSEHVELRTEVTCQFTGNTEDKWHVIRELKCISNKNYFILANNSIALKLLKPNSLSSLHQTHNKKSYRCHKECHAWHSVLSNLCLTIVWLHSRNVALFVTISISLETVDVMAWAENLCHCVMIGKSYFYMQSQNLGKNYYGTATCI